MKLFDHLASRSEKNVRFNILRKICPRKKLPDTARQKQLPEIKGQETGGRK